MGRKENGFIVGTRNRKRERERLGTRDICERCGQERLKEKSLFAFVFSIYCSLVRVWKREEGRGSVTE